MKYLIFLILVSLAFAFPHPRRPLGDAMYRAPDHITYVHNPTIRQVYYPSNHPSSATIQNTYYSVSHPAAREDGSPLNNERILRESHPFRRYSSMQPTVTVVNSIDPARAHGPFNMANHPRFHYARANGPLSARAAQTVVSEKTYNPNNVNENSDFLPPFPLEDQINRDGGTCN